MIVSDDEAESNKFNALEMWSKKRDTFVVLGSSAEQQCMGYQQTVDISSVTNKSNKSQKSNGIILKIKGIQIFESNLKKIIYENTNQ